MGEDNKQPSCSDSLLLCCLCKNLLRDPVQLQCLHSCCRQCLSSTADHDMSNHVKCPSCNRVTQTCDAEPNAFLEHLVRGYAAIADTKICSLCNENGDSHVIALVWCGACQQSLCGDCIPAHNRYNRNHSTQSLDELKSWDDLLLKSQSPPSCSFHSRPLEIICFTCEKAKCLECWATCNKSQHKTSLMNDDLFTVGLQNVKSALSSTEDVILKKSEIFQKCKSVLTELKSARAVHLERLQQIKRRIIDSVESVYQEIELATRSMYDSVEMEAQSLAAVATSLEESITFSRDYVHRLVESNSSCDLWSQQKVVRNNLISLSCELDKLKILSDESKSICIEPSLPENLEYVLRSWIGEPRLDGASASSQPQSQLLCASSSSVQLPNNPCDVALTQDGHVVLAARAQGLIEFCTRGHELSQWRPPIQNSGTGDDVEAVHALSDGRVAVGVFYSQMIILLRRSTDNSPSHTKWIEDRRLDKLQLPPSRLSVHGNTLAVSMWKSGDKPGTWFHGPQLALMSLSSGKRLADFTREYSIGDIAVVAQAIITVSSAKIILDDNRRTFVIDAHDCTSDARLWRYEPLNDNELLQSIVPDCSTRVLYVAFKMNDGSSGRVASISLKDGSEQRHDVLNFDDRLLPLFVSLDASGTVVATLCRNHKAVQKTTLTLHLIKMV